MIFSSFLGMRHDIAKLFFRALLVIGIAIFAAVSFGAAAHGSVQEPTNYTEAVARTNYYCTQTNWNKPVPSAFGAYPTNVNFNTSTGAIKYDINIVWRGCPNASGYSNSYAFAITGYPSNGLAMCPNVGIYGNTTNSPTYDCLKYVDSTYPNSTNAQLDCPPIGHGEICTNSAFEEKNIGIKQPRPGPGIRTLTIKDMTGQVPGWSTKTLTSGSHSFGRTSALCAYWHYPGGELVPNQLCQNFRIAVSWTRFNYELTPNISSIPDVIEQADSSIPVSGSISHALGSSTNSHSGIDWELTRTVFNPGANVNTNTLDGGSPCSNTRVSSGDCETMKSGTTGSSVVTRGTPYTSGISDTSENSDWPAGTQVCFQLSISRYGASSSQTGWRHSQLRCAVVGKKPKVQVHGGSLQVGRAFNGAGLSDSRVEGSVTSLRSPTRLYGSWVEYGIFAPGVVQNVASGSGLNDGSNQSAQSRWSCLTFANAPTIVPGNASCSNAGPFGGYAMQNAELPNIAARYPVSGTTPRVNFVNLTTTPKNRVVTTDGAVTMGGGQLNKGEWLVVNAGNRTVTITGDLRYNDSAELQSASDIPQLVIIARDINIRSGVNRIDAWLIATDTITTCSDYGTAQQLGDLGGTTALPNSFKLTTGRCNRSLTVNGPVVADSIWLRRTHGASGTTSDAGTPAETFNLRPDAYMWAAERIQPDVYRTTNLSERPPRY